MAGNGEKRRRSTTSTAVCTVLLLALVSSTLQVSQGNVLPTRTVTGSRRQLRAKPVPQACHALFFLVSIICACAGGRACVQHRANACALGLRLWAWVCVAAFDAQFGDLGS
jgi:hypothetical protein